MVALMFPLVSYVLVHVGLPWLHAAKRFSDLQLAKVHRWIDERYREEGLDPDAAEAAADALCEELQSITDAEARGAWERLAEAMNSKADSGTAAGVRVSPMLSSATRPRLSSLPGRPASRRRASRSSALALSRSSFNR